MAIISILISVIIVIIAISLVYPLFLLINVPKSIFDESLKIFFIYVFTLITNIIGGVFVSILQALGDSKRPFILSLISGLLNMLLDLLFISVFNMGIAGAALATVLCQALFGIVAFLLTKKHLNIETKERFIYDKKYVKELMKIGIPSVIQQAVMSVGSLAILALINSYGSEIISANTVAEQINGLLFIPAVAITNAYATFVSIFFNIILWKYSKSYKIASESIKQINLDEIEIQ